MSDRELLSAVELFEELEPNELGSIADASGVRILNRGDVLFTEGDEPNELFVVVSGRIAIANRSIDGRESVLALMERGDLFGEMPLFDGLSRSAEARALEPSEVIAIPYAPLRELYESRPALLWKVVGPAGRRASATPTRRWPTRSSSTSPAARPSACSSCPATRDEFSLPVTQEELAGMVGASRERVNKAIASFIRLGWIEQSDRRYRITNREQLERRAR